MSDEDLEDIGIENAGHRLKLINAILKLNRTMVGVTSGCHSDLLYPRSESR